MQLAPNDCRNQLGFLIEQRVHGGGVNHITGPTVTAKQTALDAYLARTAAIHTKLERLQLLADDHFGHDPQFQARLQRFADHPLVGAVELVANRDTKAAFDPIGKVGAECLKHCQDNGLIGRAIGDVMAFCPPLIITPTQVDELFDKFERAMALTLEWANGQGLLAA